MATKKDLVEAHAFSKRRLITAFVSGAPGGREVEPVRPGRVLIGGIALSVLLLAGAAIAGFLIGRPNSAWLEQGSFVISKETGERYVVLRGGDDPLLQRVPNYLSAQLLLGEPELTANRVSRHLHPRGRPRARPRHRRRAHPPGGRRPDRRRLDGVHRRRHRHQAHPHRGPGHRRAAPVGLPGQQRWLGVARRAEPDGQRLPARAPRRPHHRRRHRRPAGLRRDLHGTEGPRGVAQPVPARGGPRRGLLRAHRRRVARRLRGRRDRPLPLQRRRPRAHAEPQPTSSGRTVPSR